MCMEVPVVIYGQQAWVYFLLMGKDVDAGGYCVRYIVFWPATESRKK